MSDFNYGGQSYDVIDYGVAASTPRRSYTEGPRCFNNRAEQEMRMLEPEDYEHPFITVYSESGYAYHTGETSKALRISMVGQDYVYSPSVKKVTFCNAMAVYYRTNSSYRLLWKTGRFVPEIRPLFLNKEKLEEVLLTVFKKVTLKLGQLTEKGIPFIAWEATTEKGVFYITWHNGAIVENTENLCFTEKDFQEVKRTYKVLRFAPCNDTKNAYRVVCA